MNQKTVHAKSITPMVAFVDDNVAVVGIPINRDLVIGGPISVSCRTLSVTGTVVDFYDHEHLDTKEPMTSVKIRITES